MPTTTIYLIRHGARHDYNNPAGWKAQCNRLGIENLDPPLSALGHQQAREVAVALKDEPITHLLCSPYVRVLQTAQPLAQALGKPLCVEHGLAEFKHHPARIAPHLGVRVAVLPEVDDLYESAFPSECFALDQDGQEPVLEYLRRILVVARELPQRHAGTAIACFSHAASVALVAALTGCDTLEAAGTFAPCGIWKLCSEDGGSTWKVVQRGESNEGHVSANDPSTYSWGFKHSRSSERCEQDWKQARRLGPTRTDGGGDSAKAKADARSAPAECKEGDMAASSAGGGAAMGLGLALGVVLGLGVGLVLGARRRA